MHALCRPALRGNAAHQIMRIADQMIAMAKILQIIITTEAADQCPVAFRREARGALHPGHHHIGFEILQCAAKARLGQQIKRTAKGQFHRLQSCGAQPCGAVLISSDHRQHLIPALMQGDSGAFEKTFRPADRRAGHDLRDLHGLRPPWRSGSSRAFK